MGLKQIVVACLSATTFFANADSYFDAKLGGADTPITGSASADGAKNAAPSLEKCEKPLGTLAISEPQNEITAALRQYKLPPPTQLLRLIVQQSNCFQVVERGLGMKNIMQERALAEGGQLQQGQNIGKGQLVAADFVMTPSVVFSTSNAGGAGLGAIGGLFGHVGAVAGAVASGIKFKQAQTSLIVSDTRSGLQVAAAEGNVEKADWGIGGVIGGVSAGAYSNTAEGKVVAAALLDNYNNIVKSVKNLPVLSQPKASEASQQNAAAAAKAGAFIAGDVLSPKIGGIALYDSASKKGKVLKKLNKTDELVVLGEEDSGFQKVQSNYGEGWVELILLKKN